MTICVGSVVRDSYEFVVSHFQETPTWRSMPILCVSSPSFVPNFIIFFQLSYLLLLSRQDSLPRLGTYFRILPTAAFVSKAKMSICTLHSTCSRFFRPDPFIISYICSNLSFPSVWILSQLNLSVWTLPKLSPTSPASLSSTCLCQPHISFFSFIP